MDILVTDPYVLAQRIGILEAKVRELEAVRDHQAKAQKDPMATAPVVAQLAAD